ncbi:F-box domain-containing protein [Plasmodiophora brassicae]
MVGQLLPDDLRYPVLSFADDDDLQGLASVSRSARRVATVAVRQRLTQAGGFRPRRTRVSPFALGVAASIIRERRPIPDKRTLAVLVRAFMRRRDAGTVVACFADPYRSAEFIRLSEILWQLPRVDVLNAWLACPGADPGAYRNEAFVLACARNLVDIVECLLQDDRVDPSARASQALREAAAAGRIDIVRILLRDGRASPLACQGQALHGAARHGRSAVFDLLLSDDRLAGYEYHHLDHRRFVMICTSRTGEHRVPRSRS